MNRAHRIGFLIAILSGLAGTGFAADLDGPLAPDQAPRSFVLEPGLRLELVAAEPLIASPVALAFDERGRLYVVENRGYPTGPKPGEPPLGRIARLEDTDGDGRMDRRVVFADDLTFPNGLLPWKGGLIVTCAPDVLYLRDNDGDGKADERRVLFTGFSTAGSTQLRVSHPTLGVDSWVYLTSGLTGGKITNPSFPDRPAVALARTDFRFRPDRDAWEAADGGAQFGQSFDDFGRRFICYNRVQVQHVAIGSQTLRRNPELAFSETVQNCPAETVAEPLKGHGAAARLFPISKNITTADSHAGTFTAACAVTVLGSTGGPRTGLPETYRGGAFSCDPTGNLVHFDRLVPKGATFSAVRERPGVEFLASRDTWFRPVFLAQGPDDALYVCDMYRKTIEHPDYLPVEIRKRTDFESGKTMGRIWRVVRDDADPDAVRELRGRDIAGKTTEELVDLLASTPYRFWRQAAQRLLLERRDPKAAEALAEVARGSDAPGAIAALYLLDALNGLSDDVLRGALTRRSAPVREAALALIEVRIDRDRAWLPLVRERAGDDDARVRFQTAIALGAVIGSDEAVASSLASIAARDGADRWLRAAVFSGLKDRAKPFLVALRGHKTLAPELLSELGRLLGASRSRAEWPELSRLVIEGDGFTPEEQAALLTGLAESVRGQVDSGAVLSALIGLDLEGSLRTLVAAMRTNALDPARPLASRLVAVGLLAYADLDRAFEPLLALVRTGEPTALQVAAARALALRREDRIVPALLASDQFARYPPGVRDEVLSVLLAQPGHLPAVLSALEGGTVPVGAIDALRRRQLSQSRDPEIRRRAEALFGAVAGDRAKVYESYKDLAEATGDPARGRAVFRRECASCHRLDREGFAVGPDLFGIRNQPKASILLHILAPDHEITPGFTAYTVALKDGRVLTGLIASETATSLTLRQPLGKEDQILRTEIDELSASKQSLMPQGLEKNIKRDEFADLLSYLKGEGTPARENTP